MKKSLSLSMWGISVTLIKDRQMILIDCLIASSNFIHFKDVVGSENLLI
jgi:hypothetical protein